MRISDWSSDVCSSDLCRHRHCSRRAGPWRSASEAMRSCARLKMESAAWVTSSVIRGVLVKPQVHRACPDPLLVRSCAAPRCQRSEEHTSELQSLMRISYAVFCLKKKTSSLIHQFLYIASH